MPTPDLEILICLLFVGAFVALNAIVLRAAFAARSGQRGGDNHGLGARTLLALVGIWELPLLLLFDPNGCLLADYIAHAGQAAAASDLLRRGVWLVHATDTVQLIGDPTISVAGRLNILAEAYLATAVGANVAIRLLVFLVAAIQVRVTYAAARRVTDNEPVALVVCALSYWTTYAANTIYDRGAIAEYLAGSLSISAIALLVVWWNDESERTGALELAGLAACVTGFTLTHPITGVLGSVMLIVAVGVLAALKPIRWRRLKPALFAIAAILLILSPWVWLLAVHPPSEGAIAATFALRRYSGLDEAWLRILPFPLSRLPQELGHPYFVTQVNTLAAAAALVILTAIGPAVARRSIAALGALAAMAVVGFVISVDPILDPLLPRFILAAQFGYRLVAPVNQALLLLLIGGLALAGERAASRRRRIILGALGIASALGVAANLIAIAPNLTYTKLEPAAGWFGKRIVVPYPYLRVRPSAAELESFAQSNGCSYAMMHAPDEYIRCTTAEWVDIRFDPSTARAVPNRLAGADRVDSERWITTNVVFYPWNHLFAGDREVTCEGFQYFCRFRGVDWKSVHYRLVPETTYVVLDRISVTLFVVLLGFVAGSLLAGAYRRRLGLARVADVDP
jgi:hypothetical protein